jgi:hypothetical protein
MSVLILRPNSDVSNQQKSITDGNATSSYAFIDEETRSTDGNMAGGTVTGSFTDIYGLPDHTSESGTINKVTIKAYCYMDLVGTIAEAVYFNPILKIGSTSYNGGDQSVTNASGSPTLYTYEWSSNPAGGSWGSDWSVIDGLSAGNYLTKIYTDKNNQKIAKCQQFWVEVTYGEGGGATVKPHHYYLQQ